MAGLMGLSRGGFCATRRLMMAMSTPGGMPPNGFRADNGVKDCTGLTGIAVNQNARAELIGLNAELMAQAAALPATAVYRTSVESTCSHTLSVLESGVTDAEAEATLGLGQLEEQLLAAKDELNLMVMMGSWKPWEGAAADTVVSTTEMIEDPGVFPDTMFSEGLVSEATRTAGAKAKTAVEHAEMGDDEEYVSEMKGRDPTVNVGVGKNKY